MPPISKEQAAAVKKAVDVVEVVRRYVPLRRQGKQWVGACPLHPGDGGDHCLTVSPDYQNWRCWRCGVWGDAITAVMRFEEVAFPLAVNFLAKQAEAGNLARAF